MQPAAIAAGGFEGVGERVAVIERGAKARLFALVALDDVGLELARAQDEVANNRRVASQHAGRVLFLKLEKPLVENDAVFDDFGEPASVFARRQRVESRGVDPNA